MRITAVAALLVLAGTVGAFSDECRFVDAYGSWVDFDPMKATLHRPDGTSEDCDLVSTGTESDNRWAICGEYDYAFFAAPSVMGSEERDLLIFMNTVFYWTCDGVQKRASAGSDQPLSGSGE
jgi:hypothetical protein